MTVPLLLLSFTGEAAGRRFEISNQAIRATFAALAFTATPVLGDLEARCPVTLEGTFHSRTIAKESERLIGYITRAVLNRAACTFIEGARHVTILNGVERLLTGEVPPTSLPWHIRYEGFEGSLPFITEFIVRIVLLSFLYLAFEFSCLYRSTAASPARFSFIRNTMTKQATSFLPIVEATIPRVSGNMIACPVSSILEGPSAVRLLGSATTLIFFQLI
jgi:hypothetical protein